MEKTIEELTTDLKNAQQKVQDFHFKRKQVIDYLKIIKQKFKNKKASSDKIKFAEDQKKVSEISRKVRDDNMQVREMREELRAIKTKLRVLKEQNSIFEDDSTETL